MKIFFTAMFFLMTCISGTLVAEESLASAELSLARAAATAPSAINYLEKAGAIGINRKKEREYFVEASGNELFSVVTVANEGRHHKSDPRPPAEVGDREALDFAKIINDLNPFNRDLQTSRIRKGETVEIDGIQVQTYQFECTTTDDDGSFPSTGELLLDIDTGMVRRIKIERTAFPDDIRAQFWVLDFDGTGPENCRLASRYYESQGRYAIFVYKFRTTDTYNY